MVNGTFATDSIVTGGRRPAGRGAGVVALADQPVGPIATEGTDCHAAATVVIVDPSRGNPQRPRGRLIFQRAERG